MIHLPVDWERRVLDAVSIPAWHTPEMRMRRVDAVVGGIVPAQDNVSLHAMLVFDEEIRKTGTVWHKVCLDAGRLDQVFAIGVWSGTSTWDGGAGRSGRKEGSYEKEELRLHFELCEIEALILGQLTIEGEKNPLWGRQGKLYTQLQELSPRIQLPKLSQDGPGS